MQQLSEEHGGFAYECIAAKIDEQAIRADKPEELVRLLAAAKATAILGKTPLAQGYLITCDQVHALLLPPRAPVLHCPADPLLLHRGSRLKGEGLQPPSSLSPYVTLCCTMAAPRQLPRMHSIATHAQTKWWP